MSLLVSSTVAQRSCFGQYEGYWAIHDVAARMLVDQIKTIGVDRVVEAGTQHPQGLFANPMEVVIDLETAGYDPQMVYEIEFLEADEDGDGDDDRVEADRAGNPAYVLANGIAVIPIVGAMTKRPSSLGAAFDGSVTSGMRKALNLAMMDDRVQAVMFHIDSGGGSVSGVPDLADDIFEARKQKQIFAYVEDGGFSAAYWVATQANVLGMSPNAQVGSIGVMAVLYDTSELAKKEGVKVELFQSVPGKALFVSGMKMTQKQKDTIQADVEGFHEMFINAVNRGRGRDMSAVADGSIHFAQAALEKGMVDRVASFTDFFAAAEGSVRNSFESRTTLGSPGMPMADEPTLAELQAELAAEKQARTAAEQRASAFEAAIKAGSGKPDDDDEPVTPDAVRTELAALRADRDKFEANIETLNKEVAAAKDKALTAEANGWVAEQSKLYEVPDAMKERIAAMYKTDPEAAQEFTKSYGARKMAPEAPRGSTAATQVDDDQVDDLVAVIDPKRFASAKKEVKA